MQLLQRCHRCLGDDQIKHRPFDSHMGGQKIMSVGTNGLGDRQVKDVVSLCKVQSIFLAPENV